MEPSTGLYVQVWAVMHMPHDYVTPLLHNLHWMPICFKILVITYEVLHGIGTGYLRDCLSSLEAVLPIRTNSVDALWGPSIKQCRLPDPRKHPSLLQHLPYEMRYPLRSGWFPPCWCSKKPYRPHLVVYHFAHFFSLLKSGTIVCSLLILFLYWRYYIQQRHLELGSIKPNKQVNKYLRDEIIFFLFWISQLPFTILYVCK